MGSFSIWHWLIVLLIVVMVFGTKKLRNMGGDLGGAVKGFKDGMKDGSPGSNADTPPVNGPAASAAAAPVNHPTAQVGSASGPDKTTIDVDARQKF